MDLEKAFHPKRLPIHLQKIYIWLRIKKIYIGGIFCDLTKAFDCVNHDLLMAELEHYGIQDVTDNWLKSYLIGRKQGVK